MYRDLFNSGEVLGAVVERTIEQQKTMEQIKLRVDIDGQEGVRQIQEQVVNQVAQHIVVVDGPEGRNEFFQEVKHVWAPGTSAGGTSGVQYAGGTGPTSVITDGVIEFAPGTSEHGENKLAP